MTIHADNPAREPAAAPGATANTDETERNDAAEGETEAEDTEGEPSEEGETGDGEAEGEGESVTEGPDGETVEVEEGGKKFRIPKAAEGGFLRQADYTRKTQALAGERTNFETDKTRFTEFAQAAEKTVVERGQLAMVDFQLGEFQKVDWNALLKSDNPEDQRTYHQLQHGLKELQGQRAAIVGKIQDAEKKFIDEQRADLAKRVAETRAHNEKTIPGWSEAEDQRMVGDAKRFFGVTRDRLINAGVHADPLTYSILWDAVQYRRLLEKKPAKPSTKPADAVTPKPAAKVTGKGPSAKPGLHDNLSTEEWMRRANAQTTRKRKRDW